MRRAVPAAFIALFATGTLACSSASLDPKIGDGGAEAGFGDDAETGLPPHDPQGYEPWWYPECKTADGSCPPETCLPNHVVVVKDRCGPYEDLDVGCVSRMTLVAGWFCVMRKSDGVLIYTQYGPKGGDFGPCGEVPGPLPVPGALCRDGGSD